MIIFKMKLNEVVKTKIINNHINPFMPVDDIPFEIDICVVYDNCRPIFIKNKLYNNIDDVLRFISKHSSIINLYKNNERINISDFANHIMDLTIDAMDLDNMKDIKALNNIHQELSKDNMGTIWMNKNN